MEIKILVTSLLLVFSFTVFGQKVKKKKKELNIGEGIAHYTVLKSDKSVKHGVYYQKLRPFNGNAIIIYGNYSFGKKEGLWTERHHNRLNSIKNQGYYKNGKRVGVWNFYDSLEALKGIETIMQKYNYDTNELVMSTEWTNHKEYEVYYDGKLSVKKLDKPPAFIGGVDYLISILSQKFIFSFYVKGAPKGKKGQILKINNEFSILVKKDGTIGDIKFRGSNVNSDLMNFLEIEILNYNDQWIAGELNGKKVDAYLDATLRLEIKFNK